MYTGAPYLALVPACAVAGYLYIRVRPCLLSSTHLVRMHTSPGDPPRHVFHGVHEHGLGVGVLRHPLNCVIGLEQKTCRVHFQPPPPQLPCAWPRQAWKPGVSGQRSVPCHTHPNGITSTHCFQCCSHTDRCHLVATLPRTAPAISTQGSAPPATSKGPVTLMVSMYIVVPEYSINV